MIIGRAFPKIIVGTKTFLAALSTSLVGRAVATIIVGTTLPTIIAGTKFDGCCQNPNKTTKHNTISTL